MRIGSKNHRHGVQEKDLLGIFNMLMVYVVMKLDEITRRGCKIISLLSHKTEEFDNCSKEVRGKN